MFTLDWSSKDSVALITEYRNHPILWDKNVSGYKNKLKRIDAWTDIANKFGCSKSEVERKMGILLTQYRREKHKIMMKYYDGADDPYCSTWYAFQEFSFLESYKARMQQDGEVKIAHYPQRFITHAPSLRHRVARPSLSHLLQIESDATKVKASVPLSPPHPEESVETVTSEPLSQPEPDVIHDNEDSLLEPQNSSVRNQDNQRTISPSVEEVRDKQQGNPAMILYPYAHNSRPRRFLRRTPSTYPSHQQTCAQNVSKPLKRKKRNDDIESSKILRSLATKLVKEDDCDHIGANVTLKLRSMEKSQRIIAEKLISDVIFYGHINELKVTARVYPEMDKTSS